MRAIPIQTGSIRLAQLLQRIFQAQAREVAMRLTLDSEHPPDLTPWIAATANATKPILLALWRSGMARTATRLSGERTEIVGPTGGVADGMRRHTPGNAAIFGEHKGGRASGLMQPMTSLPDSSLVFADTIERTKDEKQPNPLSFPRSSVRKSSPLINLDFDFFNPRILDAVDAAAFAFCRETLATATDELQASLDDLRKLLRAGLARGDALRLLGQEVGRIFADPQRAFRIAATEASRASNGGQLMAARESGVVVGKRWLASSSACERCLDLDGEERALDEPFWVDPKGGMYAICQFPPLHPHCFCSFTELI